MTDGWKYGDIKPRLCITPPHATRACRALAFPRAVDIAGRHFRAKKRGVWRLDLNVDGDHHVRGAVAVGGARAASPKPRPKVLATGVAMQRPDGATLQCCDAPWVAEYIRRARSMMKTYIRHGRGHVLWLTIPTPKAPENAALISVTNAAILRAADGLAGAQVLRLDLLFTPNGYSEYITHRGQAVRVRQNDGVHLTVAGNAIAAEAIEKFLRRAPGWLGRGS